MKHIKSINELFYTQGYFDIVDDLFLDLSDLKFTYKITNGKIIENRDDWGNDKISLIYGKKFIVYGPSTKMNGNSGLIYTPKDVILVRCSSPLRSILGEYQRHEQKLPSLDDEIIKSQIPQMIKRLGYLNLYGIGRRSYYMPDNNLLDIYDFAFYDPEFTKMAF